MIKHSRKLQIPWQALHRFSGALYFAVQCLLFFFCSLGCMETGHQVAIAMRSRYLFI